MVTALVLAHNGIENIELVVKSFQLFCDVEVSLVIVDDGTTDGLQDWAKDQEDITYVFLDEGKMNSGAVLNMVRKELGIDTDLLTMEGNYMLTPKQQLPFFYFPLSILNTHFHFSKYSFINLFLYLS